MNHLQPAAILVIFPRGRTLGRFSFSGNRDFPVKSPIRDSVANHELKLMPNFSFFTSGVELFRQLEESAGLAPEKGRPGNGRVDPPGFPGILPFLLKIDVLAATQASQVAGAVE
ncbi:MAG: hypothetical protein WA433_04000 [Desulfobaccales bacterium]